MSAQEAGNEGGGFPLGPVQILVVGFDEPKFTGQILPELKRLRDLDLVRLLDLMVVQKNDEGEIDVHMQSDLSKDEALEFGALIGALIGIGTGEVEETAIAGAAALDDGHVIDEDTVWYIADTIPKGSAAAIALLEHRWAIPLRDKIVDAGGFPLADEWIHPADLIALGIAASEAGTAVGA